MREIPADLQTALDSGASTLARCWAITRRDGLTLGFTDHDRNLFFEGISFEPDSGFTRSALETSTGLAADTHTVSGALQSPRITEEDIRKGIYDGAEVALYLVNWQDVLVRLLLSRGQIGEIRRQGAAFEAEITGLADQLGVTFGRTYIHSCACRLGDDKCGIDLSAPENRGTGTLVSAGAPQRLTVSGLESFEDAWFAGGLLTWTSGANSGVQSPVKAQASDGAETVVELWRAPPLTGAEGDAFEISAGCDKTRATCHERFGNLLNFRGFPHIPGDDFAASYPSTGGAHDGGSLFRT